MLEINDNESAETFCLSICLSVFLRWGPNVENINVKNDSERININVEFLI